jgi:glutathione S-transferase
MKLFTWGPAPNPRRVRMFAAEKGIELPTEDVGAGWALKREFLERSPHRLTPMLELDDGTLIGEAPAICRYLEALHPEPPLMGRNPKECAVIEMWERSCEYDGLQAIAEVFRNTVPAFVDRGLAGYSVPVPQIPALVERGRLRAAAFFAKLDGQLSCARYVAGEQFTFADITALCALDFGKRVSVEPAPSATHIARWYAEVAARPSSRV